MTTALSRVLPTLVALAILAFGMLWIGHAERTLWRHAPASTLDRYALDRLLPELPPRVELDDLWTLCSKRPLWSYFWKPRTALAACLDASPENDVTGLDQQVEYWRTIVEKQIAAAQLVQEIPPETVTETILALRAFHDRMRHESGGILWQWADLLPLGSLVAAARPQAEIPLPDAAVVTHAFVDRQKATHARLDELTARWSAASTSQMHWETARDLALLASGFKLSHEYAHVQPKPVIEANPDVLGEGLEWARRAKPRGGQLLERMLTGYMNMMIGSALVAVLFAGFFRASPALTALLFLICTLGGLQLIDLSVTGAVESRHLATRDFGEGFFCLHFGPISLWGPALVFLAAILSGYAVSASNPGSKAARMGVLWPARYIGIALSLAALAILLLPGMAALKTELFGLLLAVPLSIFAARYAPLIKLGVNEWSLGVYALPLLIAAVIAISLGGILRADIGATAVAMLIGLLFLAMLSTRRWFQLGLTVIIVGGVFAYGQFLYSGLGADHLHVLPRHAQERFLTARAAGLHGQPDVKQVEWIIRLANQPGENGRGFGWGQSPWNGVPGTAKGRALPIPAASDLSMVLPAAIGGLNYALAVIGTIAGTLAFLIWRGFSTAVGDEVRIGTRFCAALGGFGLLIAFVRLAFSVGGTTQILPLTGVPIIYLSHSPTATATALFFSGLILGACSPHFHTQDH